MRGREGEGKGEVREGGGEGKGEVRQNDLTRPSDGQKKKS